MSRKTQPLALLLLVAILIVGVVLPMTAQDTTTENTTIVTGAITFDAGGHILVSGYIIAPAGGFNPSSLHEGDVVVIIGRLLPDGVTIQADSLELFEEPEVEVTPELTPEATVEATPETTPEATTEPEVCGNAAHPVATRIAAEFEVSYDEVMAMHCAGNGFGNIVRAFLLAEASGSTPQSFLDRHQAGEGWGQIMRASGQHPSTFAPGRAIGKNQDAAATPQASNNGQGNGNNGNGNNGNGNNGNGNNGNNGNGNGNGGGNGNNGNGNNGNNGNGNGNGKGKGGN